MKQNWNRLWVAMEFVYGFDDEWDKSRIFPVVRDLKTMSSNIWIGNQDIKTCFEADVEMSLAEQLVLEILTKGMVELERNLDDGEEVSIWLIGKINFEEDIDRLDFEMVNYQTEFII